jgi:hypothetical protein
MAKQVKEQKEEKTPLEIKVIENAPLEDQDQVAELQLSLKGESPVVPKHVGKSNLTLQQSKLINSSDPFKSMTDLMEFSGLLATGKITPFGTKEQIATIMLYGKELGLSPVSSLYNLYYIENKPCLSVHAHNALLTSKGIVSSTIEDGVNIDANGDPVPAKDRVDVRTTIKFFRKNPMFPEPITELGSFTFVEAKKAGLTDKGNWKNFPRQMLWNRAYTIGARRIASDILLGCMEISEMADVVGMDYELTPENSVKFK